MGQFDFGGRLMAKRCASAAILDTLRDPRVFTMQPGAQLLWLRLVTAMQNQNLSVLRIGSDIMKPNEISMLIQLPETEIETHTQTLIDRGLLGRDHDGALTCPMLVAAVTRSEINKINGSKGGRPRKDSSPPGQRSMLLPIDGKTKITETQTKSETEMPETSTYLLKESAKEVKVSSVSDTEYHATGRAALDAAGFDPARSMATYGIVRQWLADGADRELIIEVINRKMRPGITTLNYFTAAIGEAIAARPAKKPEWEKQFEIALSNWELCGRGMVPMPRLADFKERTAA
jgi:hypothetical protein